MRTYETLILFPVNLPGESVQEGKSVFEDILKKHEGKIISRTELGRKFLGYTVKKQKEANLISFVFELTPSKVDAFKHALQLAEEILKFTLVQWEKPAPAPQKRISKRPPSATQAVHAGEKR